MERGDVVAGAAPARRHFQGGRSGTASALLSACRPRQWLKNVLVAAVPAAAGELTDVDVAVNTALAFAAFCLASSATYLLNDISDREADRLHPVKGQRAIASGRLSVRAASTALALIVAGSLAIAAAASLALLGVIVGYMALTTAYSRWLKHEPVFDIVLVAAGFFLRAVGGGVASGIHISSWFLIVAAGASVFVVAAKRYAEVGRLTDGSPSTRRVLASYSPNYLESVASVAAGVTVVAYCLWAFEDGAELGSGWRAASAVPFVVALMRYGLLVDHGRGEEPEDIFLHDRVLQGIVLSWVALVGLGVLL